MNARITSLTSLAAEHSTAAGADTDNSSARSRRPDLSTFFANLNEISPREDRNRPHAVPVPGDVAGAYRSLAEAFNVMRRHGGGGDAGDIPFPVHDGREEQEQEETNHDGTNARLLTQMITTLLHEAEAPPREITGVDDAFCDALDRVPRNKLAPGLTCPICNTPFLDDPYPLVVRLPCHSTHMFDLECIRPWLRLRGSCPMDRHDFGAKERAKEEERVQRMLKRQGPGERGRRGEENDDDEDDEDALDGMYG